ncbi:hypothetical protein B0H16DRAFT_1470841 [Mycena metata]|uniref:Uncharacterized protein n=1 Tax=Mycena metata TaxID=1033252 RepID=A0AAD7HUQ5_9AGAR|nr:hypothetical protein B0H16DRAFT_1470841 [Mycena metata]
MNDTEPNPFNVNATPQPDNWQRAMDDLQAMDDLEAYLQTSHTDPSTDSSLASSPTLFGLTRVSDIPEFSNGAATQSGIIHSPQARYPGVQSVSTSTLSSSFGFTPAFPRHIEHSLLVGPSAVPLTSAPSFEQLVDQGAPEDDLLATQRVQPPSSDLNLHARGSLAYIRRRTPAPPGPVAVYIGFPFDNNPARQGFFETEIYVGSLTPRLSDLFHALQVVGRVTADVLNIICAGTDYGEFHVGWSKTMVEAHETDTPVMRGNGSEGGNPWFTLAHGYREVGALQDHLHHSATMVERAIHNDTSHSIFHVKRLNSETPLFVLYVFPLRVQLSRISDIVVRATSRTQGRSQTPALPLATTSSGFIPLATFLPGLLKATSRLDTEFLAEAHELTALRARGYGPAYLQIREALIIEKVLIRCGHMLNLDRPDVASWAGFKPRTFANNWTFVTDARGTLLLLTRVNSQLQNQSSDVREKEKLLKDCLTAFFRADLLPAEWFIHNAQKTYTTHIKLGASHYELRPYLQHMKAAGYKKEPYVVHVVPQ